MQGSEISLHGGDGVAESDRAPLPGELGYSSGTGSSGGFSNDPGRASVPGPIAGAAGPSTQRGDDRRIGQIIDGKYHVLRRLACGGMGSVYEARHTVVGRHFALKFLHEQYAQRSCMVQRFLREAQAAGSIASEHIIGVLDYGTTEGTPYLVMELVRGQDLREILAETPRLPARRAVRIVLDACRGLALAHERGLVHRDLKPANICVTRRSDGREVAKVIDFGVAKLRDGAELSEEGTLIGTLGYMAPEQLTDQRQLDARADIYALGVILYQAIAGRPPHICNRSELLYRIVSVDPKPLAELCPELPSGLADVVHKALCRSKERRYGSVRELAHALERFAGDDTQPVSTPTLASSVGELRRDAAADRSSGLGTAETEVGATPTWAALAHGADQKADRQCESSAGLDATRSPSLEQYCRHPDGLPLPPPPARHHHLSQRALLLSVGALLLSVVAMTTMFVFVYSHGSGALESAATARMPARLAAAVAAEDESAAPPVAGDGLDEPETALAPAELCKPLRPASVSSERAGVRVQRRALEPSRARGPAHPSAGAPGIDCE